MSGTGLRHAVPHDSRVAVRVREVDVEPSVAPRTAGRTPSRAGPARRCGHLPRDVQERLLEHGAVFDDPDRARLLDDEEACGVAGRGRKVHRLVEGAADSARDARPEAGSWRLPRRALHSTRKHRPPRRPSDSPSPVRHSRGASVLARAGRAGRRSSCGGEGGRHGNEGRDRDDEGDASHGGMIPHSATHITPRGRDGSVRRSRRGASCRSRREARSAVPQAHRSCASSDRRAT